jgi:hypothetical protein
VVQTNHAEIPLKLTNKRNVTEVREGGSVWANNGRTVHPLLRLLNSYLGRKNTVVWLIRSVARVTEAVVRDKKFMNTTFLAYLTHRGNSKLNRNLFYMNTPDRWK